MKEIGLMINQMDRESDIMKMEINIMKEIFVMKSLKEKANPFIKAEKFYLMVNSKIIIQMALENIT